MVWELNESQVLVATTFRKIADQLMGEDVTLKLLRTSDHNSEEYENISQLVRKRNKELVKEAWGSNPEFAQAVVDFYFLVLMTTYVVIFLDGFLMTLLPRD